MENSTKYVVTKNGVRISGQCYGSVAEAEAEAQRLRQLLESQGKVQEAVEVKPLLME